MKRIGILGAGQLGCMLAESLHTLGAQVAMFDPDPHAPGRERAGSFTCAPWTDAKALTQFAQACDAVTYEFENVDADTLAPLEATLSVLPSSAVLRTTQHRVREKRFLRESTLPSVAFHALRETESLEQVLTHFGTPAVVKTVRGGYDGKGQWSVRTAQDIQSLVRETTHRQIATDQLIIERSVPDLVELSCIVARTRDGEVIVMCASENLHSRHILDFSISPPRLPDALVSRANELACEAATKLDVVGLLTVEFFATRTAHDAPHAARVDDWYLMINEFAPRPHNSGHLTRVGHQLSQFDALARIVLGLPLHAQQRLHTGTLCMGNLLGDTWLAQGRDELDLSAWREHPSVIEVALYGKREARAGRKMGHYVTSAPTADAALEQARAFRKALEQGSQPP